MYINTFGEAYIIFTSIYRTTETIIIQQARKYQALNNCIPKMEIKLFSRGGNKASPKRSSRNNNDVLEAIAKVNRGNINGGVICESEEVDGVVRVKIVVRKQDLKQIMEAMGGGSNKCKDIANRSPSSSMPSFCVEQRLNLLRKKHLLMRANLARQQQKSHCSWSPALQSIPEEVF